MRQWSSRLTPRTQRTFLSLPGWTFNESGQLAPLQVNEPLTRRPSPPLGPYARGSPKSGLDWETRLSTVPSGLPATCCCMVPWDVVPSFTAFADTSTFSQPLRLLHAICKLVLAWTTWIPLPTASWTAQLLLLSWIGSLRLGPNCQASISRVLRTSSLQMTFPTGLDLDPLQPSSGCGLCSV